MKTVFVAPYVPSSVDAIKLAALYFDEVVLQHRWLIRAKPLKRKGRTVSGVVTQVIPAIDPALLEAVTPLQQEGLVSVQSKPPTMFRPKDRQRLHKAFTGIGDLLLSIAAGPVGPVIHIYDNAFDEVHAKLAEPLRPGARFDLKAIITYYEGLFVEAVESALRGDQVLSSSDALQRMMARVLSDGFLNTKQLTEVFPGYVSPQLAMDVLRTSVVNPSGLDCVDVLEVRHQLRDELVAFRVELQRLQFEFAREFGLEKVMREGQLIATARLEPRVREIEAKLKGSRLRLLRRLVESLEKPDAYVPLVGSMFAGVPVAIALGLSLGIISTRLALETIENYREVANNGLFYLVKMRKVLSRRRQVSAVAPLSNSHRDKGSSDVGELLWWEDVEILPEGL